MLRFLVLAVLLFGTVAFAADDKPSPNNPIGEWQTPDNKDGVMRLTTIRFSDHRLIMTHKPGVSSPVTLIEADYSITKDGILYGIVTRIDKPESMKDGPEEEDTFSMRFRVDDDVLNVKEIKGKGFESPGLKRFLGRFKKSSEPPKVIIQDKKK